MRRLIASVLLVLTGSMLVGCNTRDDHGDQTQFNDTLMGRYWYVSFARSVSTSITPDVQARAGIVNADGMGTLTFGPNIGSPLPATMRNYFVNTNRQIDNDSEEPGSTLDSGDFFQLGDLDRMTGNDVGMWLCTRAATGMSVDRLVDGGATGTYHAFLIRFNRPGVTTGIGSAVINRNSATTATWSIDYSLSTTSSISRNGSMSLAADGATSVMDASTNRSYTGFAEGNGDWLAWIETNASGTQVVRVDILIRKGSGMSDANLNGRFNLVGFYESLAQNDVDTIFGRMFFDGRGAYSDFTTRDSFGNGSSTGNSAFPYSVASDGVLTFIGGSNPIGFVTRSSARRWFIFPDVDESSSARSVGFFIATSR